MDVLLASLPGTNTTVLPTPTLLSSPFGWGFSLCVAEVKGKGPNPSQTDDSLDFGVEWPLYAHIKYQRALCDVGVVLRYG